MALDGSNAGEIIASAAKEPNDGWEEERKTVLDRQNEKMKQARNKIIEMLKQTGSDLDVELDLNHLLSK